MPIFMTRDVSAILGSDANRCGNRSLFADKLPDLPVDPKDKEARKRSIQRMIKMKDDPLGWRHRADFVNLLGKSGYPSVTLAARLRGRLIIDQAGGVLENAGLCIDPHFGVPFIPGSALKGIARASARDCEADPKEIFAVFGWSSGDSALPENVRDRSFAGAISFLPAYPTGETPLVMDILTCHHPKYYQDPSVERALDKESPIPNPFPVVEAGAEFSFALAMLVRQARLAALRLALGLRPEFDPLAKAKDWLLYGLTEHGVGAKTSAGYGWFACDGEAEERRKEEAQAALQAEEKARRLQEEERQLRDEEERRRAAMSPINRTRERLLKMGDEEFAGFARALAGKTADEKRAFILTLRQEKRDRWKTWKKRKPELAEAIQLTAKEIGEVLP